MALTAFLKGFTTGFAEQAAKSIFNRNKEIRESFRKQVENYKNNKIDD